MGKGVKALNQLRRVGIGPRYLVERGRVAVNIESRDRLCR